MKVDVARSVQADREYRTGDFNRHVAIIKIVITWRLKSPVRYFSNETKRENHNRLQRISIHRKI